MKVSLDFKVGKCLIEREKGDPQFRDSEWGSGESRLLYHIKKVLNAEGWDFIKKRMYKDGHLVSDQQLYLRERKVDKGCNCCWAIWNQNWAVASANKSFNEDGKAVLSLTNMGAE